MKSLWIAVMALGLFVSVGGVFAADDVAPGKALDNQKPESAVKHKAVKAKVAAKKAVVKAKVAEKKAVVKGIEAPGPAIIQHVAKPLANDGTMASFADVPSIRLSAKNPAHLASGRVKNDADLSGDLRLAEDGKNLYIACEVTQGRGPVNKQAYDNVWNGDALELYLSSKSSMLKTSRMKKSEWDYQILLVPTSATGKPVIRAFGVDLTGAEMKATPSAKGYVVTGIVPLSNFKECDWAPGKSYKFDAALAKAGEAGVRDAHLFWNATVDAYDNPDLWGQADVK